MILSSEILVAADPRGALFLLSLEDRETGPLSVGCRGHKVLMPDPPEGCQYNRAALKIDEGRTDNAQMAPGNVTHFMNTSPWQADIEKDVYAAVFRYTDKHGACHSSTVIGTTGGLMQIANAKGVLDKSRVDFNATDRWVETPHDREQWDSWSPGRATLISRSYLRGYVPSWAVVEICGRRVAWRAGVGAGVSAIVEFKVVWNGSSDSTRECEFVSARRAKLWLMTINCCDK